MLISMPKWVYLIVALDSSKTVTQIWKEDKIKTYAYIHKIVKVLEDKEIISTTKEGRVRMITLTKKGKNLQKLLIQIKTYI